MNALLALIEHTEDCDKFTGAGTCCTCGADEAKKIYTAKESERKLMQASLIEYAEHMKEYEDALQRLKDKNAALTDELETVKRDRDAYKRIIEDVRAGNYDNANDSLAARKFIYKELAALKAGKA